MAFSICTCWPFVNYNSRTGPGDTHNNDFTLVESLLFSTRRCAVETELQKRNTSSGDAAKLRRKEDGSTLLMVASVAGDLDLVHILLKWGAPVHDEDFQGNTALLGACLGGHLAVVQALIHAGASMTQANHEGTTPLMAAAWRNRMEVLKFLIGAYSQQQPPHKRNDAPSLLSVLTTVDKMGRTPKDLAKEWSHHDIVAFLEEQQQSLVEAAKPQQR
mmetsp:Transcript_31383/g.48143  ORF Transcript_31383/g.48143 Transcript_31383/m.48143 type:complete len:217 (-) Transcript_31383:163-813(-)|eukprot:CAMPEP_0195281628 /NCGR_PEP_ID=MMETSP0707-20130614/858_1 /TAXON_ID=33640 /ORGANISM="Asterionellopsis glacialis, Strain CCMP134" /LENGTH=216 /DNA_ID=CAMNT_0040340533 /DNA_START=159 /DNA_END=809 /DNA_ORIENTATION=+